MTDDEKFRIIGRVVSDHEHAKRHLAALQAKADAIGSLCEALGDVLKLSAPLDVRGEEVHVVTGANKRRTYPLAHWPARETIEHLLAEIRETQADIAALEVRRKELGV